MSLTLHFHPLSSFCWKVLVGLYELDVPFTKNVVDLSYPAQRSALVALSPVGKFPVLRDDARGVTVPESTLILEHVDDGRLVPRDPDRARECRIRDRFFDLYVELPMQKIVGDRLRPKGARDPHGVAQARAELGSAYRIADAWLREGPWAAGAGFTMADCAAAPALFYAQKLVPFASDQRHLAAYFARLVERPSFARVLAEARPYFAMFPSA